MPKVLVSDKLSPAAIQIMEKRGLIVDMRPGLTPDALKEIIGTYDGMVVRATTKVTADVLAAARNLKVVGRAGIGVENIDVPAASEAGVVVLNTPFGNSVTTAEHAIAMMFSLARQIPQANVSTHAGKWEKTKFLGVELTGKTLGILGCGNIGAIVADRAHALHMRVICFDPFLSDDRARDLSIEKVDMDTLFAKSDFISLHTPLTEATKGIINAAALFKMKKGVRIINCARAGLIVESDLKAALEAGHVAGAALDVYSKEPAYESPFFGMDNVICTPHLGATTAEAQEIVALQIAEQVADFLTKGAIINPVNTPAISGEDAPKLRPYVELARQLGSFAGQLTDEAITQVRITYQGLVAELRSKPLTALVLEGLLKPMLDQVNMVNSASQARERGIEVVETRSAKEGDYATMIRVEVVTAAKTRSVAGTLFGGSKPRLVEVKNIPIEAELGQHMLYVTNLDKPGFIGALGSLLGKHGVNIATFHLGRQQAGGDAVLLTQVDQDLSPEILDEVRKLPQVVHAKLLSF